MSVDGSIEIVSLSNTSIVLRINSLYVDNNEMVDSTGQQAYQGQFRI